MFASNFDLGSNRRNGIYRSHRNPFTQHLTPFVKDFPKSKNIYPSKSKYFRNTIFIKSKGRKWHI